MPQSKNIKTKVGVVAVLFLLLACVVGRLDIRGSLILLMLPMPTDVEIEEDDLFFGSIARGSFRRFIVQRDAALVQEFYETELTQREWSVETKNSSSGKGTCLKIEKPPFFNAFVEIYKNETRNYTVVFIRPPSAGRSPCQSAFE